VCEVEPLALESARLEELRLAVVEGRIEADIALGRHAAVTGELERLVAEFPVRERLWRLLVLALYRDERQADALAVGAKFALAESGIPAGAMEWTLADPVAAEATCGKRTRHCVPWACGDTSLM
jgi:DNA-binding SARP family transcriptional activator